MFKRVFLIVLDSLGVGEAIDAKEYGDSGSNTLESIVKGRNYNLNVMEKLGFLKLVGKDTVRTIGYSGFIRPSNPGKDTLNGHYEMMGIKTEVPFKTYPDGFPLELISEIQKVTGREVIGNIVASGTEIIKELGEMHIKTGAIIIYTSADSVLQVAAHESVIPLKELYSICEKIRNLTNNDTYKIGRVIARPFTGKLNDFVRTSNRKDFSLDPPYNYLDILNENKLEVIALGKIKDIFNNKSITKGLKTMNNVDGLMKLVDFSKSNFKGLCFLNLNDFDSLYGHRRDKDGYLKALEEFNHYLPIFLNLTSEKDLIIFTADHGNDPTFKGTDHTRENLPLIVYSKAFRRTGNLHTMQTLADIGATIIDNFELIDTIKTGRSFLDLLH